MYQLDLKLGTLGTLYERDALTGEVQRPRVLSRGMIWLVLAAASWLIVWWIGRLVFRLLVGLTRLVH